MSDGVEKAILAGGCFWAMEDLFRKRPGVTSTRVGYTGGNVLRVTYSNHDGYAMARRSSASGLWSAQRASILPSRRDMRLEKEPAGSAAFERR